MTITHHDERITALLKWLTDDLNLPPCHFDIASSDASFRRYFRVQHQQKSYIVMDAPPHKENTAPFIKVASLFQQLGLQVPQIIAQNIQQGFLLLDDFGSHCLLDVLDEHNVDSLYTLALKNLLPLQVPLNQAAHELPDYDSALLKTELQLFSDWFLQTHCQIKLDPSLRAILTESYQYLIDSAQQQVQVCVHRDYHSRNLMYINANSLGVIDFQDAVIGPITYDAVSLLRDCYISWSDKQINQCLDTYYQQLLDKQLIQCSRAQFQQDFDLMGIQRHLKAIGIFARLNHRDGKPTYLNDIPRTLHYVLNVSTQYSALKPLHDFLSHSPQLNKFLI